MTSSPYQQVRRIMIVRAELWATLRTALSNHSGIARRIGAATNYNAECALMDELARKLTEAVVKDEKDVFNQDQKAT